MESGWCMRRATFPHCPTDSPSARARETAKYQQERRDQQHSLDLEKVENIYVKCLMEEEDLLTLVEVMSITVTQTIDRDQENDRRYVHRVVFHGQVVLIMEKITKII